MKKLVIVESPSKSKTIEQYLGADYKVLSSKGHIRDLAISGVGGLGLDIENNFTPKYVGKELFDHERLTPRSAKREISLDRIFDRDYWLPPKKEPNNLWGEVIEDDIKKGKMLKRIMRAKRRERKKEDEQQRMKD